MLSDTHYITRIFYSSWSIHKLLLALYDVWELFYLLFTTVFFTWPSIVFSHAHAGKYSAKYLRDLYYTSSELIVTVAPSFLVTNINFKLLWLPWDKISVYSTQQFLQALFSTPLSAQQSGNWPQGVRCTKFGSPFSGVTVLCCVLFHV